MTPARPAPDDPGKPRMVIDYGGMQIHDHRHSIRVTLTKDAPRGIRGCLRIEGFTLQRDGSWTAPNNPMSIMTAQAIGKEFFPGNSNG